MNIYQLVKDTYTKTMGEAPRTADVERLVGTLRVAGATGSTEKDIRLAKSIIRNNLKRLQIRTAGIEANTQMVETGSMEPVTHATKFKDIEALVKKKTCPRCKQAMVPVKLSDYRTAIYCQGDKVTLWTD